MRQVQIICNHMELLAKIGDRRCDGILLPALGLHLWENIYNDLHIDGRIWELCDLLHAMFHYFGPLGAFKVLYNADNPEATLKDCLERLQQDWSVDEYNESSELAMLSILVHMTHGFSPRNWYGVQTDKITCMELCLQQARSHAANIELHSPQLTKSRPYLRWIITQECYERRSKCSYSYRDQRQKHFYDAFGVAISDWPIPIYLPVGPGDITWPAPDPDFPPSQSLKWALSISRELEDYETESMCLQELICRERDPRALFAELDNLHKNTQGDNLAHFDSCISQYLLTSDDESRRNLIRKLEEAVKTFKPDAENDICTFMRRSGLVALNGLYLSFPEYHAERRENKAIIGVLDRTASLVPNRTDDVRLPTQSDQRRHWELYPGIDERSLLREEDAIEEIIEGLHMLQGTESRVYNILVDALKREEDALQRELDAVGYQEVQKPGKEVIRGKFTQQAAKTRENASQAGTTGLHNEIQGIQPKQTNRQPTVTEFEGTSPPPELYDQPYPSVQVNAMEEVSDEESRALAIIRNQES
jgi:hypothetical protein